MIEIDTLLQTKTATKNIAFGAAYTYIAYIRDHPPANRGEKRVADYESRLRKLTPVLFLALSLRYNILSDVN